MEEEINWRRTKQEELLYNHLAETHKIKVAGDFVTITKHFKYLGLFIWYNVRDDFDVETWITAATQSMWEHKKYFDSSHMNTFSKYLTFEAVPINLLLWGCESWLPRTSLINKLEVFINCNAWNILRILIFQVKDDRITTKQIREKLYNMQAQETWLQLDKCPSSEK